MLLACQFIHSSSVGGVCCSVDVDRYGCSSFGGVGIGGGRFCRNICGCSCESPGHISWLFLVNKY